MKKLFFVVILGLVFSMSQSLFAQSANTESEYYYVSYPITKIYLYTTGYVVLYEKGYNIVRTFIPYEWFTNPDGYADLIPQGTGTVQPRMTIYYRNGVFSHVRVYARRDMRHETWGMVPLTVDKDQYFRFIEEIELDS